MQEKDDKTRDLSLCVTKSGDNLTKIGKKYDVSVADILKVNKDIKDPTKIQVGQIINIPAKTENTTNTSPNLDPKNTGDIKNQETGNNETTRNDLSLKQQLQAFNFSQLPLYTSGVTYELTGDPKKAAAAGAAVAEGQAAVNAAKQKLKQEAAEVFDDVANFFKSEGVAKAGWKVGDDIYAPTAKGNAPSWSTVRQRFWKNEAAKANSSDIYGAENIDRMRRGLAPQRYNPDKGAMESMELSHEPIPFRDGGKNFVPRWPQDHATVDPFRYPGY
ncbi:LysM peptidoglycan-binding domain-containing protein [Candidatus Formimonas warabiya]|uniref:LysM domain-containing protein n=1 Tax=Formimonas warabiya TaxID=1761012 RepID=A0A3G1KS70_FORW1|nr:LysM domain-containing protein [Candidatus Formimonas warabiya]ATW25296.1 hypothetical protein DCMF_11420 [Candidatus Formimonas warabiya]